MQDPPLSMSSPPPVPSSDGTCRPNDANNPDITSNEMKTSLKALLTAMDGLSTTGVRRSRAGGAARATTACHHQPPQQQQQQQQQQQEQQQPATSDETDSNIQKPADNIFGRVAAMVGRSLQDEVRAHSPICEYEDVLDDQKYTLRISVPVMMQSRLQDEAAATTSATATIRNSLRPRRGRRPRPNDGDGTLMSSLNNRVGPPIRSSIRGANLEDELLGAKNENNHGLDNDEGANKAEDVTVDDDCSLTCALSNETSTLSHSTIPNASGGDDYRSRFHSSLGTDATDGSERQQNPPTFVGGSSICERDGWYTLSTLIDEEIAKTEKNSKWYR